MSYFEKHLNNFKKGPKQNESYAILTQE